MTVPAMTATTSRQIVRRRSVLRPNALASLSSKVIRFSFLASSVTFYNSDSGIESGVSFTEVNKPIVITSDEEAYTSENDKYSISDCNMVQFVYYSSATLIKDLSDNWVRKENTGVKYIENRPIIIQTEDFDIEIGDAVRTLNLTYIDVNSNAQTEMDYDNIDVINSLESNANYSNVTVNREQLDDDYFLKTKTFKDETTIGVQSMITELDVNIERGIAESYQKHNMLGEICTLQDLENYKNGRYLDKK